MDFTNTITKSRCGTNFESVVALGYTIFSTLSSTIFNPSLLIQSICSFHISIRYTSFCLDNIPPYKLPIAPAPIIPIFIHPPPCIIHLNNFRSTM